VLLHGPSARGRELAVGGRASDFAAGLEAVYGITSVAAPPVESAESA
jgi:glutamyl-tRNA reductase